MFLKACGGLWWRSFMWVVVLATGGAANKGLRGPRLVGFVTGMVRSSNFGICGGFGASRGIVSVCTVLPAAVNSFNIIMTYGGCSGSFGVKISILERVRRIRRDVGTSGIAVISSSCFSSRTGGCTLHGGVGLMSESGLLRLTGECRSEASRAALSGAPCSNKTSRCVRRRCPRCACSTSSVRCLVDEESDGPTICGGALCERVSRSERSKFSSVLGENNSGSGHNDLSDNMAGLCGCRSEGGTFNRNSLLGGLVGGPVILVVLIMTISCVVSCITKGLLGMSTKVDKLMRVIITLLLSCNLSLCASEGESFVIGKAFVFFVSLVVLVVLVFIWFGVVAVGCG